MPKCVVCGFEETSKYGWLMVPAEDTNKRIPFCSLLCGLKWKSRTLKRHDIPLVGYARN